MQRTLNYIAAELEHRATTGQNDEVKKEDRIQRMMDRDAEWERVCGGNPKWGEGRAAHHNRRGEGARAKLRNLLRKRINIGEATSAAEMKDKPPSSQGPTT